MTITKRQVLCFIWIEGHFPINFPTNNLEDNVVNASMVG